MCTLETAGVEVDQAATVTYGKRIGVVHPPYKELCPVLNGVSFRPPRGGNNSPNALVEHAGHAPNVHLLCVKALAQQHLQRLVP